MSEGMKKLIEEHAPADSFKYQLLDRMKQDCKYFLGAGNGCTKYLWTGTVKDHIEDMKLLFASFPEDCKPEWITLTEIESLEQDMKEMELKRVREDVRKSLENQGYLNNDWVADIVEIVTPGKVLWKEKVQGAYTGGTTELYLN